MSKLYTIKHQSPLDIRVHFLNDFARNTARAFLDEHQGDFMSFEIGDILPPENQRRKWWEFFFGVELITELSVQYNQPQWSGHMTIQPLLDKLDWLEEQGATSYSSYTPEIDVAYKLRFL